MDNIQNLLNTFEGTKLFIFMCICLIIPLLINIFYTLAIIRLCKRSGEKKWRYLAWLPNFNIYYTCKLGYGNPLALITFILSVITSKFNFKLGNITISTNGLVPDNIRIIINMIISILIFSTIIKLYKRYSNHFVLYTILTILSFGLLTPILLFTIRNNQIKQLSIEEDNYGTNASEFVKLNSETNKMQNKKSEIQQKVNVEENEEYDIRNSWDGPK